MSQSGFEWINKEVQAGRMRQQELEICQRASEADDPNIFLGYFTLRSDEERPQQYCPICQHSAITCTTPTLHKNDWYASGIQLWPWQIELLTGNVLDKHGQPAHTVAVIGGPGCGKSLLLAAMSAVHCALNPGFIYLCPAPTDTQNEAVMREWSKFFGQGTRFYDAFVRRKPRANPLQIQYANGALHQLFTTSAFSGSRTASQTKLGKEGDIVAYDEAGIDTKFSVSMNVLTGRMRGTRPDGRARGVQLGNGQVYTYMMLISNPHPDNSEWDNFIAFARDARGFAVRNVSITDNHTFTDEQSDAMRARTIAAVVTAGGDIEDAYNILNGIQDGISGGEFFSREAMQKVIDDSYAPEVQSPLYKKGESGYLYFTTPPLPGRLYALAVDPGVSKAPQRNAPVVGLWDVTDINSIFLVGMYWGTETAGDERSYLQRLTSWMDSHAANAAMDTTGPQVVLLNSRYLVNYKSRIYPINYAGGKKQAAQIALQQDAMAGILHLPGNISQIKTQMRRYTWADSRKVPQDIVSMMLVMNTWRRTLAYARTLEETAEKQANDLILQRSLNARHIPHEANRGHRPRTAR